MAKFFITTPIYYVNDVPHIGSAYTTLAADVLARSHRQYGDEVRFITGTDEHGAKIARKAKEVKSTPEKYVKKISDDFKLMWDQLEISYDQFVRTTVKEHKQLAQTVIQELYEREYIYPGTYEGWYCVGCEEYKEVVPGTGTDKDPICDIHKKPLEFIKESIYYFNLSKFQKQLVELIESDKFQVRPESRKNEVIGFLKGEPLRDIPVTRSKVSWGVPVPFDEKQTIYVWFEALLNYISFSGIDIKYSLSEHSRVEGLPQGKPSLPARQAGTGSGSNLWVDIREQVAKQSSWPPDYQLIGKDILRFHAVIWPAMLLALELPLPKELFVHGFFTINGQKMSKSLGNVISPREMIERYGVEATRYLIVSAFPFGSDGDISLEKFDTAYTADLANGLGNLLQRVIVLINKYGIKPQIEARGDEQIILRQAQDIKKAYLENDLTKAIELTMQRVSDANRYIASEAPWAMENDAERENMLVKLYEELLTIAKALTPLMPETVATIQKQLDSLKPEPLFPRLEH